MFGWILGRVNMKLEVWKEQLISNAVKEILLKTVVQALPQYAMSIFKILISVCKAIEKKIANFWWRNCQSEAGLHWKRWEVPKMRKNKGALGFRDLIFINKAMLGKQA
ncbi:C2H2-type domain-containing protein [Psidium guajava]|nr:C2H2-type domain-containing protein [Psidium guajava]